MRHYRNLTIFISIILLAMLSGACQPKVDETGDGDGRDGVDGGTSAPTVGDLELTTVDGFTIAATFAQGDGEGDRPAVLLVHMLAKDRHTFDELQVKLAEKGISSLSIDLRGHGDSTADGTLNYANFSLDEWRAVSNDLKAGLEFFRTTDNIDDRLTAIVGASIGANLAAILTADELTENPRVAPKALVLLSPGRNYKEFSPLERGRELRTIPVLIVSSPGDTGSYATSQALSQASKGELKEFEGDGHGTDLFESHPELLDEIAVWLYNRVANQDLPGDEPTSIGEGATFDQ